MKNSPLHHAYAFLHKAGFSQRNLVLFQNADEVFDLIHHPSHAKIQKYMREKRVDRVLEDLKSISLQEIGDTLLKKTIRVVLRGDADYPAQLLSLEYPPEILYIRGGVDFWNTIFCAILWSRNPSLEGRQNARLVAQDLSIAGVVVVSGGAYGIDLVAHKAALEKGKPTVCITGTGPDIDYPASHSGWFSEIAATGAVISLFPLGTKAFPAFFPIRNEIVVGLSRGVVVAEARKNSGTLITARLALDFGRDLFVCPGDMLRWSCEGSNELLRDGCAKCILGAGDILREWNLISAKETPKKLTSTGDMLGDMLLRMLQEKPRNLDDIVELTEKDPSQLLSKLSFLEATGRIWQDGAGRYFLLC